MSLLPPEFYSTSAPVIRTAITNTSSPACLEPGYEDGYQRGWRDALAWVGHSIEHDSDANKSRLPSPVESPKDSKQ